MEYPWLFVSIFLGLVAILVLLIYGLGRLIKWQANKPVKRFFAPIPRPGSFSFVALEGKVVDIIESVVGWRLIEKDERDERGKKKVGANCFTLGKKIKSGLLEDYLGVKWIGFFATIERFLKWQWSEFQQIEVKEDGKKVLKYEIVLRDPKDVTDFFFQFPYPVITDDAEIKGNIRVKITAVLTVLHLHPIRAFHLNKDPVALFNAMVQSAFRSYVINMNFDQVKAIKASDDKENRGEKTFWNVLKKLNGIEMDETTGDPIYDKAEPLGLFGKLGYYVARAEVVQVEAVGDTAAALEAARLADLRGEAQVKAAEKAAQAEIAKAEGDATAMDKRREARKRWVQDTIVDPTGGPGVHVTDVLVAEQVAASKVTTWVKGGGAMIAVSPTEGEKPTK